MTVANGQLTIKVSALLTDWNVGAAICRPRDDVGIVPYGIIEGAYQEIATGGKAAFAMTTKIGNCPLSTVHCQFIKFPLFFFVHLCYNNKNYWNGRFSYAQKE